MWNWNSLTKRNLLAAALVCLLAGSAAAQTVSVGPIAGAPGDTVAVPIYISDSPALSGLQVNVAFDDASVATFYDVTTEGTFAGDLIAAGAFSQKGATGFVAAADSAVAVSRDTLVVLHFILSDQTAVTEGTLTVKLSVGDNPPQSQTHELETIAVASDVAVTVAADVLLTDQANTVALEIGDVSGLDVRGYQFDLVYDPAMIKITGADRSGTLSESGQFAANAVSEGRFRVVWANTAALSGSGTLLNLNVNALQKGAVLIRFENVKFVDANGAVVPVATQDKLILTSTTANEPAGALPSEFALRSVYPNPFREALQVRVDLPRPAEVEVVLYDVLGRQVWARRLGTLPAGSERAIQVDGSSLSAGIYFLRVRATADNGTTFERVARVVHVK